MAEVRQARRAGRVSNVFGWQSAEALGSGFNSALGASRTALRAFAEIGLRMVGIAYNVTNVFGAGCLTSGNRLT